MNGGGGAATVSRGRISGRLAVRGGSLGGEVSGLRWSRAVGRVRIRRGPIAFVGIKA